MMTVAPNVELRPSPSRSAIPISGEIRQYESLTDYSTVITYEFESLPRLRYNAGQSSTSSIQAHGRRVRGALSPL